MLFEGCGYLAVLGLEGDATGCEFTDGEQEAEDIRRQEWRQ